LPCTLIVLILLSTAPYITTTLLPSTPFAHTHSSLSFFLHIYTPQHVNNTNPSTHISITSDKLAAATLALFSTVSVLVLSMAGYFQSRSNRRPCVHPWWFLLVLLLLLVSGCHASRGMQPFKGKPLGRGISNHFFGYLPRGRVPPSGPSRQHNSIGTEDKETP
jgi:hypothetical protein